jgi:hypothetical protein
MDINFGRDIELTIGSREYELFPEAHAQLSAILNCPSSLFIGCYPHPLFIPPPSRYQLFPLLQDRQLL